VRDDLGHARGATAGPATPPGATLADRPSPVTFTRQDLVALADRMLTAVRPYASPGHGRISLPGAEGGYGHAVDGLEGFARTFLLAGFRIAGDRGEGPVATELAQWYAEGIAAGTDPTAPDRWVRLPEHGQAKVEAASIALILDLTRPWIWDRLDPAVQARVVDYLAPAVGDDTYPRINWVWFRLVVQTFLRSVGGPHSLAEMADDLATHDTFTRADGWLADGASRAYDHYVGWALHLYPTLWSRMAGSEDLAAPRRQHDTQALDRFLRDAVHLVGADGSPLIQGRSLIYRFAAAAPFWVGALAQVPSVRQGQLRHAAAAILGHFERHGSPDDRGLLTMGWFHEWRKLAQHYSGPGSPYWATKGMLGLALPADHPVWTDEAVPLPVEESDTLLAVQAPGWIVSGSRIDGIVRVVNHGTDHAIPGTAPADSPLYARLGYSTATSPLLDDEAWRNPTDQAVVLLDDQGRASHRAGMATLAVRLETTSGNAVGVAGSTSQAHWVDVEIGPLNFGHDLPGAVTPAGQVTVWSLVRGPWELRLSCVDSLAAGVTADAVRLRIGGWPVVGDGTTTVDADSVTVTGDGLTSRATWIAIAGTDAEGDTTAGAGRPYELSFVDASPLGSPTRVPAIEHDVRVGAWVATMLELTGDTGLLDAAATPGQQSCQVTVDAGPVDTSPEDPMNLVGAPPAHHSPLVRVVWPDGVATSNRLDPQATAIPRPANP
jgi:hypothetical protein